jgi:hypothetical protein
MSTAMTTSQPRGLALSTFEDAFRFAGLVAKSEFAPKDFRGKPESCMLAIQHGAELGLSPMQSLQSIAVVNGRPSVYGDTALAVCKGSPLCEYVRETIEGTGEQMVAICEAKRRGDAEPVVRRFSMTNAKLAGLAGKQGPWTQYPERMLQMRARGFALRDAFPDILRGLVTAEEAQDYATEPENVRVYQPPKEPEPVEVRPKFDPEQSEAKARAAIALAANHDRLDVLNELIEDRLCDGTFTPAVADDLFSLVTQKREQLEGQEVTA